MKRLPKPPRHRPDVQEGTTQRHSELETELDDCYLWLSSPLSPSMPPSIHRGFSGSRHIPKAMKLGAETFWEKLDPFLAFHAKLVELQDLCDCVKACQISLTWDCAETPKLTSRSLAACPCAKRTLQ